MLYSRLQRFLHLLVQSVRIPTVILITEYIKSDTNNYLRCWEELETSLQSAMGHVRLELLLDINWKFVCSFYNLVKG